MELDREGPQLRVIDSLAGAVIDVDKAELPLPEGIGVHSVAMVLGGDVGPHALQIPDRLVRPPVAVFQLIGLSAVCQRQQLVAQADAEQGHLPQKLLDLLDLEDIFRRITGAVGEDHALGLCRQDVLRGSIRRQNGDGAAPLPQGGHQTLAGAVVQERDPEALLALCLEDRGLPAGGGGHRVGDGVGLQHAQVLGHLVTDDRVHHAVLSDDPGQLSGIHTPQARHSLLFQEGVQIAVHTEVGGTFAPLPHHVALHLALSLHILLNDAVVADQRIGLHDDLPRVGGVCQRLDVAAHTGGEDQLPHRVSLGAEADALDHPSVLEHQIAFFHKPSSCLPKISRNQSIS